jgi:hypothetical protein
MTTRNISTMAAEVAEHIAAEITGMGMKNPSNQNLKVGQVWLNGLNQTCTIVRKNPSPCVPFKDNFGIYYNDKGQYARSNYDESSPFDLIRLVIDPEATPTTPTTTEQTMAPTHEELNNRFSYHSPKPGQPEIYTELRSTGKYLAEKMCRLCPDSRELSLALTNLEQAIMWANAAVARRS